MGLEGLGLGWGRMQEGLQAKKEKKEQTGKRSLQLVALSNKSKIEKEFSKAGTRIHIAWPSGATEYRDLLSHTP